MVAPAIDWTEPSRTDNLGVDHLGMRVAGEVAIAKLLDFTTTVSRRVRYFSFLCWAVRRALEVAKVQGAAEDDDEFEVDLAKWRKSIKRDDYLIAGATLLDQPGAFGIAGSLKLSKAVQAAEKAVAFDIVANHLTSATGSLGIYAGSMRQMGLLRNRRGLDVVTELGARLADAFDASLAATGLKPEIDEKAPQVRALREVGGECGLAQLASAAKGIPAVLRERDLLRSVILDWESFQEGTGPAAPRMLSIGIILTLHQIAEGPVDLVGFREATLLGGLGASDGFLPLDLPEIYEKTLRQWSAYQSHAFATYALEELLSLLLEVAHDAVPESGGAIAARRLLGDLEETLDVPEELSGFDLPRSLRRWPTAPIGKVVDAIDELLPKRGANLEQEPAIYVALCDPDATPNKTAWAHNALLLLLWSIVRMRAQRNAAADSWIGDGTPWRRPPGVLVRHLEAAAAEGLSCRSYFRRCLEELVLHQHQNNALRKLLGDPTKYTALFTIESGRLSPLSRHRADTSNPRFANAVQFLIDLGFLDADRQKVTEDGARLLDTLAHGGRR